MACFQSVTLTVSKPVEVGEPGEASCPQQAEIAGLSPTLVDWHFD